MVGIAVMDIGKSNAKLSVVNADSGELVHSDSVATRQCSKPFYAHLDTEFLWRWYTAALAKAQAQVQVSITTICVTAHGATGALIDANALVLPIMDYEFTGPDELASEYDQLCDCFDKTYSPKLPAGLNLGRQLYWQKRLFPEQFNNARHLLPYAQYWSWRLSGIAAAELTSIGSHTDLWFPVERSVSDFARDQGFASLLPEILPCDSVLGRLDKRLCQSTGIDQSCEVLVGVHDSNASLVPWLKTRDLPLTIMSTGTWVIIFALGAGLETMVAERDCAVNVNIHGDPVACARFMGGREFAAVAGDDWCVANEQDLLRIIDDQIYALPAFTATGGPFPGSRGRIAAKRKLSAAERYALASLYCALLSEVSLGLAASQGDIIVEGVYARNALLLQCLQLFRSTQRLYRSDDSTGTTTGAAMLVSSHCQPPELQSVSPLSAELADKLLDYRERWLQLSTQHWLDPQACTS